MINPWVILGVVAIWLGSLFGVGTWQHSAGVNSERTKWQGKETIELQAANAEIDRLNVSARKLEGQAALAQNEASKKLQEGLKNAEIEKDKFIAGFKSHTIVLREPGTPAPRTDTSAASKPTAPACRCDGTTGGELRDETAIFLFSEAQRANRIVNQLTACQAILLSDRRACNPQP